VGGRRCTRFFYLGEAVRDLHELLWRRTTAQVYKSGKSGRECTHAIVIVVPMDRCRELPVDNHIKDVIPERKNRAAIQVSCGKR